MRIGSCPARVKRDFIVPARVTVCVVVHIPHQLDYFTHRLEILKLSLASLWANTPGDDYDLMVLDNGSCRPVVEFLTACRDRGDIDHLILSARNIGKINACRMLFDAAPGELVAYADDDVWFERGWLGAQLEVLRTFPRVGMVSARPVRKQFVYGGTCLDKYLAEFPEIDRREGHLIPDEWEREFLRSVGQIDDDAVARVAAECADVMLRCSNLEAYATATHFQFVAPRRVITDALSKRDFPRRGSEERQFEEAVESMGFVRLSTAYRYVRHMGNVITEDIRESARSSGIDPTHTVWRPVSMFWLRIFRKRPARLVLSALNRWTYFLLHHP
jgi:hypothetical protein